MIIKRFVCMILSVLFALVIQLPAGTWVETTQTDFADGQFNVNVYSASNNGSDGALNSNPGQVHDLNKDGHPDLIISNFWNNENFDCNSFIYWGSETGYTTSNRTDLPTHGATANAVADLNRDGHLDIVFCSFQNGWHKGNTDVNSLIFWGSNTGYHPGDTTGLPTMGAHSVYIGDLNHDGHLDLVFANMQSNSNVEIPSYIYWGDDDGYSVSHRTELPTHCAMAVSVADLNKDGRLDLVFSCARSNWSSSNPDDPYQFENYSYIYYGFGTSNIQYDTEHRDMLHTHGAYGNSIADLNHDGWLDIVFCNNRTEPSYNIHSFIYYGSSTGFSSVNMDSLPTHGTSACGVADLNKDGYKDIVFANGEIGFGIPCDTSYIYWGSSTGFTGGNRFDLPVYSGTSVVIGKLNNDGFIDIQMARGLDQGYSYLFYGSQDGYSVNNRDSVYTTRGHVSTKDIGNVYDRSNTESYYSSVFGDGTTIYAWGACSWQSNLPVGSDLHMALRSGNTADPDDGSWSGWQTMAFKGAKAGLPNAKYAQYRVLATANDLFESPVVGEVSVDYNPAGVTTSNDQPQVSFAEIRTDFSGAVVNYQLSSPQPVRFAVYNLQGQLVSVLASGMHQAGHYSAAWKGTDGTGQRAASGLYVCSGVIGNERYCRKVVIVR